MVKWCAYCHLLIEEKRTFESNTPCYGICLKCLSASKPPDETLYFGKPTIQELYEKFCHLGVLANYAAAKTIMDESFQIGINPMDFLIGIVQPALYQVGELFCKKNISVYQEHRFTSFCENLIHIVFQECFLKKCQNVSKTPVVLLVNAENNFHTLGLRVVEIFLMSHSISSYVVYPGVPLQNVMDLVLTLHPKIVGVSISSKEQINYVKNLEEMLSSQHRIENPKMLVGGYGVRAGFIPAGFLSSMQCLTLESLLVEIINGDLDILNQAHQKKVA